MNGVLIFRDARQYLEHGLFLLIIYYFFQHVGGSLNKGTYTKVNAMAIPKIRRQVQDFVMLINFFFGI